MESTQAFRTVKELVDLHKEGMAKPNHEYQRGNVWNTDQQKLLIDSVLRGYKLPMIYLHDRKKTVAGRTNESYDIIDGQQRITALRLFEEGSLDLFEVTDPKAKFPQFLQNQPCDWGGKNFLSLAPHLKEKFLSAEIPVIYIESEDQNEIRDLFVRLQTGTPLRGQEKRDAYPGKFTEFVFTLGGKPLITRYPGHRFFSKVAVSNSRGNTRQLAAQISMLFFSRRSDQPDVFPDIRTKDIDDYYYDNLDFDMESDECQRLWRILDKLSNLLGDDNPKIKRHESIHLVLLLDSLWDDYTEDWEDQLQKAHENFSKLLVEATLAQKQNPPNETETWLRYGLWTASGTDRGEIIQRRHQYYTAKMMEFLGDSLRPKDPKRLFGQLEREFIYWREGRKCQDCYATVTWGEMEIHHIEEHSKGGRTELKNGALVHKRCHPKGAARTQAFARKIEERRKAQAAQ